MPTDFMCNSLALCRDLTNSIANGGDRDGLPRSDAVNEPRRFLLTADSQEIMASLKFLVGALEFVRSRRTSHRQKEKENLPPGHLRHLFSQAADAAACQSEFGEERQLYI